MATKKFFILIICILSALNIKAEVYEGNCGDGTVRYHLDTDTGVLKITGKGRMWNELKASNVFWYSQRSYIKNIEISEGVTSIGEYAFYECSKITSITIPNSVTSIEDYAFSRCSNLTSVNIPYGVTSIGGWAFAECSKLTSISIPSSVKTIGIWAFAECSKLTSISIPNSVTSIGGYAFYRCSNLTSVNIPYGVTSIGGWAFAECSKLTSFSIPSSVKTIGYQALSGCNELLDVYCYARKTPTMEDDVFKNSGIQFATLYVPELSVNGYKVTDPWSKFGNVLPLEGNEPIPEPEPEYKRGDVNGDGKIGTPDIMYIVNYMLNGKFPDEK